MAFNFQPIVEGFIDHEQNESAIRALEKLKLDTWVRCNHLTGTAAKGNPNPALVHFFANPGPELI